jgi:hypothetical protein
MLEKKPAIAVAHPVKTRHSVVNYEKERRRICVVVMCTAQGKLS